MGSPASNSTPWGFLGDIGNMAFTAIQNQQTREHNLMLAKMQNQWNIDQWMRENQYNTPAAQQDRLAAGGLNPDLMYQNGAAGLMSADSPDMTSGAPADPIPFNPIDVQNRINQEKLTTAEVDKRNAEAEYYRSEAEGNRITNKFLPDQLQAGINLANSQIDLNNTQINVGKSQITLNESQAAFLRKQCEEIDGKMSKLKAEVDKIRREIKSMDEAEIHRAFQRGDMAARLGMDQAHMEALIANLNSDTDLDETLGLLQQAEADKINQETANLKIEGNKLQFDLDQAEKWDDVERGMRLATNGIDSLAGAVDKVGNFLESVKPSVTIETSSSEYDTPKGKSTKTTSHKKTKYKG